MVAEGGGSGWASLRLAKMFGLVAGMKGIVSLALGVVWTKEKP
jgi:hypothetical protein